MKIIHLADIHWRGLSRHGEYRAAFSGFFNQAKELNPDIIYVGGDIVHSKTQGISPELIDCLQWWFTSLAEIAPTHIILGNHDGLQHNKHRQDTISPIISGLNNDRLYLYKKSGTYPTGFHGFNWCVFSCFDEENWPKVTIDRDAVNIALYHGAVWGSLTDIDWEIEGDVTVDLFEDFDYSLLGDIHRQQFLNDKKTMAYCGSSIQQNYGEDPGKGFLFWDIRGKEDFDVKFFEIEHCSPFVTIDWEGTVSQTVEKARHAPDGSRFRIQSKNPIIQMAMEQVQSQIKMIKNSKEVVFKVESSFNASKIKNIGNQFTTDNLRDPGTHTRLIRGYYKGADLSEEMLECFDDLIIKYLPRVVENDNSLRNTRWQVKKLMFDNTFGYGPKNIVNFNKLNGITGIFGTNTKGKSSIMGSLMYGLFNTTDRGPIKNIHIINNRKNMCSADIDIDINGELHRISRKTIKHQTRKGDVYSSTSLEFTKILNDGSIGEDLTGEQRRDTEKILRNIIGTSEDFLMTSLASQGQMNTFISEGATARKFILTKFLDLEIFEKFLEFAKQDSSDLRSLVKNIPEANWEIEIVNLRNQLKGDKTELDIVEKNTREKRKHLESLNIQLVTSGGNDIITEDDIEIQLLKIKKIEKKKESLLAKIETINNKIEKIESNTSAIDLALSDFPIEEIRNKLEMQQNIKESLINLKHSYSLEDSKLNNQERSVSILEKVPCGDQYPACRFIKDSHANKKLIKDQRIFVKNVSAKIKSLEKTIHPLIEENLEEKIDKFNTLESKKEKNKSNAFSESLKVKSLDSDLSSICDTLSDEMRTLNDLKIKVCTGPESEIPKKIKSSILSLRSEIRTLENKRTKALGNITRYQVVIERKCDEKAQFEEIKRELKVYDMFLQAVSKKGIPLQIMMSQLPIINDEIARILQGVAGFTVQLEATIDSHSMDVYIDYGDSKRIIELASGMEKMISSLALRAALINVSSLPKSNMFIIDEGFGALDETNIEACARLLESLKQSFKNIIIISHVDAIKDAVDFNIEITKHGKDARVVYE